VEFLAPRILGHRKLISKGGFDEIQVGFRCSLPEALISLTILQNKRPGLVLIALTFLYHQSPALGLISLKFRYNERLGLSRDLTC